MARWPIHHAVAAGLGAVRRWRRRHTGDAMAMDFSPMVARPAALGGDPSRRGPGWPRGIEEDDDVRWRWNTVDPDPGPGASGN